MGRREKERKIPQSDFEEGDHAYQNAPRDASFAVIDNDYEEANEDLSLKIVEKARSRASHAASDDGVLAGSSNDTSGEDIITTELMASKVLKKKAKKAGFEIQEKTWLEEPWLHPMPWESMPSESGDSVPLSSNCTSSHDCLYDLSSVSEASVVRLVMNALQGVQSAVLSIEQLSALFCADPADRSSHRIPTLWNRSLSTCALGKMLKSIGLSGSLVILLHKFVDYFTCSSVGGSPTEKQQAEPEAADDHINVGRSVDHPPHSLVNQAFAVAVRKILEGYFSGLDTLDTSVYARRSFNNVNLLSNSSRWQGSLTDITHSEVTLLEIYLHTKELRTQIEGLGHICHLHDAALCFSLISFEDLTAKAIMQFHDFPRGGNLLTYLYRQLQIVDPAHCTLLKYLFLRSLEPYSGFIRSWIYEAKIDDPYGEFIVEYGADPMPYSYCKAGIRVDFPLATVWEQDGVDVPCFLESVSVPLLRAGQQLQVVMRLLRLCNYVHAGEYTFEDILPGLSDFKSNKVSCSPLSFNKGEIEAAVHSRRNFYSKMQEKLENIMETLDIKYRQVVLHDAASLYASNGGTLDVQYSSISDESLISPTDKRDSIRALRSMDSEASSIDEDFSFALDPLESSECSSTDGSEMQDDSAKALSHNGSLGCSKQRYLSALYFTSLSYEECSVQSPQTKQNFPLQSDLIDYHNVEPTLRKNDDSCREPVELSRSWISKFQYADHVPDLGWPVGGLLGNPLSTGRMYKDKRSFQITGSDDEMNTSGGQILDEITSCSSDQFSPTSVLMREVSNGHECPSSNSFLIQSQNGKYPWNVLSMNPMFTKHIFLHDANIFGESKLKISKTFPCFDFSSSTDPFKAYQGRLLAEQRDHIGPEFSSSTVTSAVPHVDCCVTTQDNAGNIPIGTDHIDLGGASLTLKSDNVDVHLKNACGGSSWQTLLHGSPSTTNATVRECEHTSEAVFQMPLDFIIDKCLLQEILLQYTYVSRLSIKLLERGFDLQDHFLALRRYHFMEIADWADLFITSLWHHKWYFTEADQKISEIQGLLELSIQRSSCERDHNKDRLYVYVKDQDRTPFSTAAVGVHSFDFIGLGYRVDWPVSIVLTPTAFKIYSEIFTFLIQVKLAVLSLSDVWCSLKGFRHVFSLSSECQLARSNFNYLVKLRHQVNHFVSTLQQYVLSQLSHVSWCRFHYALKHEVKDMMDLESVHMAYLRDSMQICFLADETRSISNSIDSILQCALDFRSCLVKGIGDVGSDNQDPVGCISQINVSQALSIKEKLYKNLKELHLLYLKSPKHGEFGLPRFWSYLNYNEYYSNAFDNKMGYYNLWVQ